MVYVSVWHILRDGLEAVLRIRMRTQTCSSFKQTEHSRGGLSLQTLSSEERLRCAPFLTVLGTHSISRSFPLPPQRMLASLAAVSVAAGPAPHAHPVASKRLRNQTPHAHAACGSRGLLWKRLSVGRAAATARSTDSGVRRPQMADGREGAGGEIGQSSPDDHLLRDP